MGCPALWKCPFLYKTRRKHSGDYTAQIHNFSIAKLKLAESPLKDSSVTHSKLCWMFKVRSCMIQIIQAGFSVWEFLSPYESLLNLVYPHMFIKDLVMPWAWNDAKIIRRGTPCFWKRNYTILGSMLFIIFINDLDTAVDSTGSLLRRSSGFPQWQWSGKSGELDNHQLYEIEQEQALDSPPDMESSNLYIQIRGWEAGQQPCRKRSVGLGWWGMFRW